MQEVMGLHKTLSGWDSRSRTDGGEMFEEWGLIWKGHNQQGLEGMLDGIFRVWVPTIDTYKNSNLWGWSRKGEMDFADAH